MSNLLTLPEMLDMCAAGPLLEAVRGRRGAPLRIDGSRVERLGGQCLQVLLAAQAAWAEDNSPFEICNPSAAFKDGTMLMGAEALVACAKAPSETAP